MAAIGDAFGYAGGSGVGPVTALRRVAPAVCPRCLITVEGQVGRWVSFHPLIMNLYIPSRCFGRIQPVEGRVRMYSFPAS